MFKHLDRFTKVGIGTTIGSLTVFIVAAIVGWVAVPEIIEGQVKKELQLKEDSFIYEKWLQIPVPIKLRVHIFNVTNSEDFSESWSAVPNVVDVGPFVYEETRFKDSVSRNEKENTLTYLPRSIYKFKPEESCDICKDDTQRYNFVNGPLIAVSTILATKLTLLPRTVQNMVGKFITRYNESFIKQWSVREAIFDGIDIPYVIPLEPVAQLFDIDLPKVLKDGKFSLYLNKNDSHFDGRWDVHTGEEDGKPGNKIKRIDGNPRIPFWRDDISSYCGMINGSDGIFLPPLLDKEDDLYVFVPEICRSVQLKFERETEVRGIKAWRFRMVDEGLYFHAENKGRHCFCPKFLPPLESVCEIEGLHRVNPCYADLPMVVSKPHFLDADPIVSKSCDGFKPDRSIHESFMDIEPISGITVFASMKFQSAIEVQPLNITEPFKPLSHKVMPMFWLEFQAEITDELEQDMKSKLINPIRIVTIVKWLIVSLVGAIFIISTVLTARRILINRSHGNHEIS